MTRQTDPARRSNPVAVLDGYGDLDNKDARSLQVWTVATGPSVTHRLHGVRRIPGGMSLGRHLHSATWISTGAARFLLLSKVIAKHLIWVVANPNPRIPFCPNYPEGGMGRLRALPTQIIGVSVEVDSDSVLELAETPTSDTAIIHTELGSKIVPASRPLAVVRLQVVNHHLSGTPESVTIVDARIERQHEVNSDGYYAKQNDGDHYAENHATRTLLK